MRLLCLCLLVATTALVNLVASNVEIPHEPQTSYVNCMAWTALMKVMGGDVDIRKGCNDIGNTVPRDLYRDQNLRKASD